MSEREYLIALSTFVTFGPQRLKLLISYFKKPSKIWNSSKNDLIEVGLGIKTVENFIYHRDKLDISEYLKKLESLSIKTFTIFENDYPANLKEISDAPYVLYVRGNLDKTDSRAVAIVGTRMMTSYGREVTHKFATNLANFGITVVSGLALGVDAEAQRSALDAGGRTIAVLASGLDIISPYSNKALALEFIKKNGAIVSEYPLGHMPFKANFAVRNRLISGLSKAVIVTEARIKSGTFYTVNAAANQGRPVFAVPGQITSPASEAPNYLIQNGAKLITKISDVLEELNYEVMVDREKVEKVMPTTGEEKKIVEILSVEPLHLDELVRISRMPTQVISARLTIMEMKGMIKNLGGGVYQKV
ncbi:MAG TPA: DNA-processing protein DprA [Patescibacteria group bacterium]|nr:DNA-processing protein DprA [Patescibacteria group bacterium]